LYRVIGREYIGGGRRGRYIVEYSRPWPSSAKRVYLIGVFTGWFPGHIRLRRRGDRGYAYVKLWPGIYGYGFIVDNNYEDILDPENPDKVYVNPFYDWKEGRYLSRSVVPASSDPLEEIVHDENDPSFLHRFFDELIIRLRTPEIIRDPVLITDHGNELDPETKYVFHNTVIYEYHIPLPRDNMLKYKFRFTYKDKELFYGYEGVGEEVSYIVVDISRVSGPKRPQWYMGTVYYQIFIDSFENGDPSNDPPRKISVYEPRERGYYGGDLRGIINRLEYIRSLGVETLYLTPVFKSTSYHRYDVYDYRDVDRYLGTIDDLMELIEKLHRHGMRIVLDIPLHHTSSCFPAFIDALKNGRNSRYWNWYCFLEEPSREIVKEILKYLEPECRADELNQEFHWRRRLKPFYECFFMVWSMPKINHDCMETLDYFIEITRYWIERGVDGFRIDVGLGIHSQWLKAYYIAVKSLKNDFLLLGELNDYPVYYSEYFDSMMDYYWRKVLLERVVDKRITIEHLIYSLNRLYGEIPHYQAVSLYHSLGTHDTPRIKTIVGSDKARLKLLYTLLFTLPGSPAIYYGDEIGMEGGNDPDNRRPMIWDKHRWDTEILEHIRKLIRIYGESQALRIGYVSIRQLGKNTLLIKRWYRDETIYTIANTIDQKIRVKPDLEGEYIDLYNGETYHMEKNKEITLDKYGFHILRPKYT